MKSFIIINILVFVSVYVGGQSSPPKPPMPGAPNGGKPLITGEYNDGEGCCKVKKVGGKMFKLVGKSDLAWEYQCSSDCTYMVPGYDVKYCFKPGPYESECQDEAGYKPPKPPMTGGPNGSKPPMTGGPNGSKPPMTGGFTGSKPPMTEGFTGSKPPMTEGFTGSKPPMTGGFTGSKPPMTDGFTGSKPPMTEGPNGSKSPMT